MISTDVVIIGGGSAGIAAAVAVSRQGLRSILVDKNPYPGGNATAAEVGTICGAYVFTPSPQHTYIAGGFMKEFTDLLQARSKTEILCNEEGLHYLPYSISAFQEISMNFLKNKLIQCYFDSKIIEIEQKSSKIEKIIFDNKSKKISVKCQALIDCSGNGISHRLTGQSLIEDEKTQAAALVFSVQKLKEADEKKLGFILAKHMIGGIAAKVLPAYCDRIYVVQGSLQNNSVSLKIGIPMEVDSIAHNEQSLKEIGQETIHLIFNYLKSNSDIFKESEIGHIASNVGIRTSSRPLGKYVLTQNDVLSCRKFDDFIAKGSWPVEIWKQDRRVEMHYFERNNYYHIPMGAICSASFENLFFGGRNISADSGAIASARVIGTCLQTGYAAGLKAALTLKGETEQNILGAIQKSLLSN